MLETAYWPATDEIELTETSCGGVLRAAAQRWRVDGATLYVTLEPCPMCAGALVNARVGRLVFGATDEKAGAVRSLYRLCDDPRLNHRMEVKSGVLADECAAVLKRFFAEARARRKRGEARPIPSNPSPRGEGPHVD